MAWIRWIALGLGFLLGAWLTFDGARALFVGDYVTPKSGQYAGQLGPWSKVVAAVGIAPRSLAVKVAHVGLGLLWLLAAAAFAFRQVWAWWLMVALAFSSLWYLPFGTIVAASELILLFLPALRLRGSA